MCVGNGNFLLEVSQENPEAARIELESLGKDNFQFIRGSASTFEIMGNADPARDSVFVKSISNILLKGSDLDDLGSVVLPAGKFYVRFRDADRCGAVYSESEIGNILGARGRVDFRNPDFTVRVVHDGCVYVGIEERLAGRSDLEERRPPKRPFFSPISIHPKFARFMVNISRTKPGDTILDPFCGTGGILIEAGLMGRHVIGSDSSYAMVRGARLNLKYYGISDPVVSRSDVKDLEVKRNVDAIVSDLPYGRNSEVLGEDLKTLYSVSLSKFHALLQRDKLAVLAVSDPDNLDTTGGQFEVMSVTPVRQHKSLTRYFVVLKSL